MLLSHRRHDISDRVWQVLEPHLPGRKGTWGGNARDNRLFINAVFWILRTGAPWRDLAPDYGDWKNTHRRFCRWRDKGVWERLLEHLIEDPDFEWLMIDATHVKVHPHGTGARGGNQDMSRTKGGSTARYIWPWIGMPVRILITDGTTADCTQAGHLIKGLDAGALLADKAYDVDAIIVMAYHAGMEVVIPPKKNRKTVRDYDKYIYKLRHLVENAFLHLKRWRGIASRYAKNTASFLAAVQIRCIALWANIS